MLMPWQEERKYIGTRCGGMGGGKHMQRVTEWKWHVLTCELAAESNMYFRGEMEKMTTAFSKLIEHK